MRNKTESFSRIKIFRRNKDKVILEMLSNSDYIQKIECIDSDPWNSNENNWIFQESFNVVKSLFCSFKNEDVCIDPSLRQERESL